MFDNVNRDRKCNAPPSDRAFLQILLGLLNECDADTSYSVTAEELTRYIQIVLRDEFNGDVSAGVNNCISLRFTNGQQFNIKIEKARAV